jgi:hypothetical protein
MDNIGGLSYTYGRADDAMPGTARSGHHGRVNAQEVAVNVVDQPFRGHPSPDVPPDVDGRSRGTPVVTLYPERASNPHPAEQEGILSSFRHGSGVVRTAPDRGETGKDAGPIRSESVPNGDRSFPEMSPDGCECRCGACMDARVAAELSARVDALFRDEERLVGRIAALRHRARRLSVKVEQADKARDPFVLCSDSIGPVYVYALVSSADAKAYRYIGKTDSPRTRFAGHLSDRAAPRVRQWVRECYRAKATVVMVELWRGDDHAQAEDVERQMIADYVSLGLADLNVQGNTEAYARKASRIGRAAA